jgi:hypothetical protein
MLDSLRTLARGGMLPKWSEWFGAEVLEALVPDRNRRAVVLAELPELSISYFEGRPQMPREWSSIEGAYILLSDPYRPDAGPIPRMVGHGATRGHLDIVTRPADVAEALLEVLAA